VASVSADPEAPPIIEHHCDVEPLGIAGPDAWHAS
jgi:hypothetical protein